MVSRLLILTPQAAFGELIRQSLEQTGGYQVSVSQTANAALSLSQKNGFDLAILDFDLGVNPTLEVGQALIANLPQIKIVVIPPNNAQEKTMLGAFQPHGYLSKPFYLPDLVESLDKILGKYPSATPITPAALSEVDEGKKTGADDLENPPGESAEDHFTPNLVDQVRVAEAWFKEAEGKTVPLVGLTRYLSPTQAGNTEPVAIRLPCSDTHHEPRPSILSRPVYTCAVIPRMPQHYLTGELASRLGQWVPKACQAFGWNLEGLKIRPDYMAWIVRIPSTLSPGKMLRVIRERTSLRIYNEFQAIKHENPSGNFWAPGFLIVSGAPSLPLHVLAKYVTETRQRQGSLAK